MNSQRVEKVTQGILDRTKLDHKKAHRLALAALSGRVCPLCDDNGYVDAITSSTNEDDDSSIEVCPVCVSVEESRQ